MQASRFISAAFASLPALQPAPGLAAAVDVSVSQRRGIISGKNAKPGRQAERFLGFVLLPAGIILALTDLLICKSAGCSPAISPSLPFLTANTP